MLRTAALLALGASSSASATTAGAGGGGGELQSLSVQGVQGWLKDQNLHAAFGAYFESLAVDGEMLVQYLQADDISLAEVPAATKAHVRKLFAEVQKQQRHEEVRAANERMTRTMMMASRLFADGPAWGVPCGMPEDAS